MATQKIAVYSLSDLKNTTDDALPNYLTSLKFKQSHFHTDVRLALGYIAVVIAAITFYADYKLGWDKTKAATFWAVLVYFTLNGALTFWIWSVENGKVFTGEIDQPSTGTCLLSIASSVTKHVPVYNLNVRYGNTGKEVKTSELSAPFTRWFDADGFFVAKPFQQWLASEIPLIGQVDPQNKVGSADALASTSGSTKIPESAELQTSASPKRSDSRGQTTGNLISRKGKSLADR